MVVKISGYEFGSLYAKSDLNLTDFSFFIDSTIEFRIETVKFLLHTFKGTLKLQL